MSQAIPPPFAVVLTYHSTQTQFLSTAAKQAYFVPIAQPLSDAYLINWELRLCVYPIAAHSYCAALLLMATVLAFVHFAHARARRDVHISSDPTTIAGTLSMTSESAFPKLLQAGDTEDDIKRKLRGMTFGISRRTWQVVAEGEEEGAYPFAGGIGQGGADRERRESNSSTYKDPSYGTGTPYSFPGGAESRASFTTLDPSTYSAGAKPVDPWSGATGHKQ